MVVLVILNGIISCAENVRLPLKIIWMVEKTIFKICLKVRNKRRMRPVCYPTVELKNFTDLTKLYYLNEHQKSFYRHVTFKVKLIDTFKVNVNYSIPSDVALVMDFCLDDFSEEINKALIGKSANFIITHLIVMQIIMEKFNSKLIGICLDKDVEEMMMEQIKRNHC
jgi:hypothetical protein